MPTPEQVAEMMNRGEMSPKGFALWLARHDAEIRADERERAAQRVAAYADMEGIGLKSWDAAIAAARGEDTK